MAGVKGRSGGQRSGAGRPPNTLRVLKLHGGRDRAVARPEAVPVVPITAPDGLDASLQAIWDAHAPHAIKAGTLVPGTVSAFLRLCKAVRRHDRMEAVIDSDGMTYLEVTIDGAGQEHNKVLAHPLIGKAQTLDASIRSWFKDFGLNPFGKPLVDLTPKVEDPFAEFDVAQ